MKIKLRLAAIAFVSPVALLAASDEAILLSGKSHSQIGVTGPITVSGHAMACLSGGEGMSVNAATISFDQAGHTLVCTGDVTLTSRGHTIQADKLTITVKSDRVFVLNPDGIKVSSPGGMQAARDGHSLYIPSASWKPDQSAPGLLQSAIHGTDDQLNWSDARAALAFPAAR